MKELTGHEALVKAKELVNQQDTNIVISVNMQESTTQIFELYGHYYKMDINIKFSDAWFREIEKAEAQVLVDYFKVLHSKEIEFGGF